MFDQLESRGFQIQTLHHAAAILKHDMPAAMEELDAILGAVSLPIEELVRGGGGEGKLTQRLRGALTERGWKKHSFLITKTVNGAEKESVSHQVDHVKRFDTGTFALEIEWNNKDPFFDRDLENFKRLHSDGAISIGAIITRGSSLQEQMKALIEAFAQKAGVNSFETLDQFYTLTPRQKKLIQRAADSYGSFERGWAHVFVSDKFGEATTHWGKLADRISRGVGNPCPLLLIGIPDSVVVV